MASAEQKKSYKVVKQFKGVNTKANRTAIEEAEFSWLENAMPIGFGNLKITPTYTNLGVTFANTVIYLASVNLNLTDYLLAFEIDGRCEYVNIENLTKGNVAPIGTFSTTGNINVSQWKNTEALISDPNKGYFTWDTTNLIFVGSVNAIGITNQGSGYSSAPNVIISAPNNANGIQATAVATITTGAGTLISTNITNIGSGYTSVPSVSVSGGGGSGATISAGIQNGNVVVLTVTNPGSGYTSAPTITIAAPPSGTTATATGVVDTGLVTSVILTNAGSGYNTAPTVTFSGGGGSNAAAVAGFTTFATGTVYVQVNTGGAGYTNAANTVVTITGGGGASAAGTAIISGGIVTEVVMTNPGSGYTTAPLVAITGGGATTNATATAIVSTSQNVGIASFSGRVWIAQGRTVYYSAAGSYSDFISVSAGNVNISDSTLHGNIQQLLSANNFLYIFGDDSINVFSDVRVTSTGSTIFTNTNVSASVGTKLPYAIFPYFRSVLFMNNYGIYALVGSTTSKISDPLDGIFTNIEFATHAVYGGQVLINNILCAVFNFYYQGGQGTSTSNRYIQAVFFEKKWFFTSAINNLQYIVSAPVGGKVNLYGTDGTTLYQLYSNTSDAISSYVQTALMDMGDPIRTKQATKFGIEATGAAGAPLNVTVDSEYGSSPVVTLIDEATWINNYGTIIPWTNNSGNQIAWTDTLGYFLYKNDARQYGKYLGLTLTSNTAGFIVNTFEFEHELRVRF